MSTYATVREMKKILDEHDRLARQGRRVRRHQEVRARHDADVAASRPTCCRSRFRSRPACDSAKFAASRAERQGVAVASRHRDHGRRAQAAHRVRCARTSTRSARRTSRATTTRMISLPRWEGKKMAAADYLTEQRQPNFFFHATIDLRAAPPQRRRRWQARLPRRAERTAEMLAGLFVTPAVTAVHRGAALGARRRGPGSQSSVTPSSHRRSRKPRDVWRSGSPSAPRRSIRRRCRICRRSTRAGSRA